MKMDKATTCAPGTGRGNPCILCRLLLELSAKPKAARRRRLGSGFQNSGNLEVLTLAAIRHYSDKLLEIEGLGRTL